MSPDLWVPAVTTILIVAIVCGSSSSLLKMYMRRGSETAVPQAGLKEIRDRLGQLQQAVDTIAIEVERLSEGQRFTTKLLAEREREVAQIPPAIREGWLLVSVVASIQMRKVSGTTLYVIDLWWAVVGHAVSAHQAHVRGARVVSAVL